MRPRAEVKGMYNHTVQLRRRRNSRIAVYTLFLVTTVAVLALLGLL